MSAWSDQTTAAAARQKHQSDRLLGYGLKLSMLTALIEDGLATAPSRDTRKGDGGGVRLRKQARLSYKCPPTAAIGSTCRSLDESLDQVHVFIPRPTSHSQN